MWHEAQRNIVTEQLMQYEGSECLFFAVIGDSIRIVLNELAGVTFDQFGGTF